ncbi:sensor histidine kinase [Lapillicoccus jejuensis]|uniref:histidine kinase n=1 Tax=Lapillicoccus jejuensis TaxID=402171 RepID=A0A542E2W6_9MICO|nr:HAMP domain-containing sensor histidine kinase [Lapillicoccus jejuensis]TQJ09676.1 signal transduction histidine kinase [Lapillicoccus jejuensis]
MRPGTGGRHLHRHEPLQRMARSTYVAWLVLALVCSIVMYNLPGDETIPYHIAWAAFALAFGARVWSRTQTWAALAGFTLLTGGILVLRVSEGVLAWQETAEIPLMSLLMGLLVWNVRRRQDALTTSTELAQRELQRVADQVLLTRLTSHELRSPLTISTGYLRLLRESESDPARVADLDIVRDEVERISRTSERLLRLIRLQGDDGLELVDVDAVAREVLRRWAGVTDREWVLDVGAGEAVGSAERLRVVLDTLVENAVRYTEPGQVVRVHTGRDAQGGLVVGVADAGRGIGADRRAALTEAGATAGFTDPLEADERSQTGLGLGIVRSVAVARGGRLVVDEAPEGGVFVHIRVPAPDHATSAHPVPLAATGVGPRVVTVEHGRPVPAPHAT